MMNDVSMNDVNSTGDEADFRIEHDTMGEVRVPRDALYGAQTQRAVENFPISGTRMPAAVIEALAMIKAAAARANAKLGVLEPEEAAAIEVAASSVAGGEHADQFPIDVFQTGSGTSTNMNVNEVLATLATRELGRDVHPNDAVNASQSSNDTVPSAVHLAAALAVTNHLVPALTRLAEAFEDQAARTAVERWRFEPARDEAGPIPFEFPMNIRFKLGD